MPAELSRRARVRDPLPDPPQAPAPCVTIDGGQRIANASKS